MAITLIFLHTYLIRANIDNPFLNRYCSNILSNKLIFAYINIDYFIKYQQFNNNNNNNDNNNIIIL